MKKYFVYDIEDKVQVEVNVTDSGFMGIGDKVDSFRGSINDGQETALAFTNITNACFISVLNRTAGTILQFSIDGGTTWLPAEHDTNSQYMGVNLPVAFDSLKIKNDSGSTINYTIYVGGEGE